jgi:hypothetical protein
MHARCDNSDAFGPLPPDFHFADALANYLRQSQDAIRQTQTMQANCHELSATDE